MGKFTPNKEKEMEKFKHKNVHRMPEYKYGKKPLDYYYRVYSERTPNKTCVQYYGKDYTWSEMNSYINAMAKGLSDLGVKKGDPVALFMQNCPQFMFSFYAVQRIGGIVVPCSPMFKEWDLEYEINEINAQVIIANSYLYPIVENVIDKTPLKHVIVSSFKECLPETTTLNFDLPDKETTECKKAISMVDILDKNMDVVMPELELDMEEDIGLIIFTSGSTGMPKATMLPYIGGIYKGSGIANNFAITEYTIFLGTYPLNHIAGITLMSACAYVGAQMVLLTKATAESVMKAIDMYHCNNWYATALTVDEIVNDPNALNYNLCHMRTAYATSFGIDLTEEICNKWTKLTRGSTMLEAGYGLSETHTFGLVMPLEHNVFGSHGTPIWDDCIIKIVDDDGNECKVDEMGEIIIKCPGNLKEYYNNPEATATTLRNGYVYTGDFGKMDQEGFFYYIGRKKEMIKTSGFSVFPEEIEAYLCKHEAITQAAVIGKADERRGELIKAFVVIKPEYKGKITEEKLLEWSSEKMAAYKKPREIEFRDSLPMSPTGKLLRRVLKEEEAKKLKSVI